MGEIASVLMMTGTSGASAAGGAGAAGMTAMATGGGVNGAVGATLGGAAGAMSGGSAAEGVGAALGAVDATAAFAPETVAADGAMAKELAALDTEIMTAEEAAAEEEAIRNAASGAQSSSGLNGVKDFFGQAWENAKNDLGKNVARNGDGSVNYGKTAGNFGYGVGKSALLKAINSRDQEMPDQNQQQQQAPMKFNQSEPVNAEDELNRLRNRMNVS